MITRRGRLLTGLLAAVAALGVVLALRDENWFAAGWAFVVVLDRLVDLV